MTNFNFKPKSNHDDHGWKSRKLRHFDGPVSAQFITFRLFDSLPWEIVEKWRSECSSDADFRRRVERLLDNGRGECWLRIKEIAEIVVGALKFQNGIRYELIAWVVMPNHVHILIRLFESEHLPDILHSIKSFSAQKANQFLKRKGQFWQHESFDRYIRSSRHFAAVVRYIEDNPVKAGLCGSPEGWRFSSAFERVEGLP